MPWITVGALLSALSVACGAFGAHALAERLDPRSLELWETGSRYLMYSGLSVVLVGLAHQWSARPGYPLAAVALAVGGLVFFGTLAGIALGGPRALGMITPLGGLSMIVGLILFAYHAAR